MPISSWWLDTGRLYLRYMAAVATSIPAAVGYAYLVTNGLNSWWSSALVVCAGLGLAAIGWRVSESLFAPKVSSLPVQLTAEIYNAGINSFGMRVAGVAVAAASIAVYCAQGAHGLEQGNAEKTNSSAFSQLG
jgi:hypothetical protein